MDRGPIDKALGDKALGDKALGDKALEDHSLEARLIGLETRLAHHERLAEELSDVIAQQDKTIIALTAQVRKLTQRLGDMDGGWSASPQDGQPPPHY